MKTCNGLHQAFFNNKDVDMRTKHTYNVFMINAVLWGCESWNLSAKAKNLLESFHHGAIRRILDIYWEQVRSEKIRNIMVSFWFCNLQKINLILTKEQLLTSEILREPMKMRSQKLLQSLDVPAKKNRRTTALV
jgi:hypothetical protein